MISSLGFLLPLPTGPGAGSALEDLLLLFELSPADPLTFVSDAFFFSNICAHALIHNKLKIN